MPTEFMSDRSLVLAEPDNSDIYELFEGSRLTQERQELAMTLLLRSIFPDSVWDDSPEQTARRVIKFYREYAASPMENHPDFEFTTFEAVAGQMIVVNNIEFASICAHHLLPYVGKMHIAYICGKIQVGLSKIPRLVDWHARRPSVQEALGFNIGKDLKDRLDPKGVMVVVEARHTCMSCRGARKHNGQMITSVPFGVFLTNPSARDEFFALINREKL